MLQFGVTYRYIMVKNNEFLEPVREIAALDFKLTLRLRLRTHPQAFVQTIDMDDKQTK